MATTFINEPEFVHRANTPTAVRVTDPDTSLYENYKYIIGIAFNQHATTQFTQHNINGVIYTKLTYVGMPTLSKGDKVLLRMDTLSDLDGIFTVLEINGNDVTIDLPFQLSVPVLETFNVYNFINYKFTPDLEGEAKTQIQEIITSFVKSQKPDLSSLQQEANSTEFQYWLVSGREYTFNQPFIDNTSISGQLGFVTTIDPVGDIQIGDVINVIQDGYEWNSILTLNDGGNLQLSNPGNITNFQVGQTIQVFGNGINGFYEILSINGTDDAITINFPFVTGIGPSVISYGNPSPQYNGVTTVVAIHTDTPVVGQWTIEVDKPFNQSTQAISGKIYHYPNKKITDDIFEFNNKSAYHGTNKLNDYDTSRMYSTYFCDDDDKLPSTIMIDREYWLSEKVFQLDKKLTYKFLIHTSYIVPSYFQLVLRDNTGSVLFNGDMPLPLNDRNYYFEVNPTFWIGTNGLTQTMVDNAVTGNYQLFEGDNDSEMTTQFRINYVNKCSKFQYKYALTFEDHLGSYISLPFFMRRKKMIDKVNHGIYHNKGKFNLSNNTFGVDTMDGGNENYATDYITSYTLNSDYLINTENIMIEDLFTSNNIFLTELNSTQTSIRVHLTKNKLNLIDSLDDLVKYSLEVTESTKQKIK